MIGTNAAAPHNHSAAQDAPSIASRLRICGCLTQIFCFASRWKIPHKILKGCVDGPLYRKVTFAEEPTLTLVKMLDIEMKRRLVRSFLIRRNSTTAQVPALIAFRVSQRASVEQSVIPPLQGFSGTPADPVSYSPML